MEGIGTAASPALPRGRKQWEHVAPASLAAWVTVASVVLMTGVALWLRIEGLAGWQGTLSVDEARLAMAGRGILEYGVPVLPSGWTYTRGLLAAYLLAPSLSWLGATDFAARLPSVLAGAALVPVAYLLGTSVAGRLAGLFAGAFVAGHSSLVIWSRQAWFYALYVLLFTAALAFIIRAQRTTRVRDQIVAGVLVGLTLFAHELGIFLLLPLGVQVLARLWATRQDRRRWLAPLGALAMVAVAALLLWLLVTGLRASSLVGTYGEVDEYFQPRLEGSNVRFYLRMLLDGPGLLLAAALVGIPLALRTRRVPTLLLWLALVPPFVHAAFIIPRGPQERYGLTLLVVIAVLAADSVVGWAERLGLRLSTGSLGAPFVAATLLGVMLLAHQDVNAVRERAALNPREGSWLREIRTLGIGPDDLVMSDVPTIAGWYVGGLDYWVSSREYEKYATRDGDILRDVHTGAVLVRNRSDFDRLVARPHAGRTVWIVASGRNYQWQELVDADFRAFLDRSSTRRINPGDNTRIWRMDLPLPS